MFHTIITTAYIIPNVYVYLRILKLFINKDHILKYTIIYLLIFSIFPVSNLISDGDAGFLTNILSNISDYILPFYLYLFLSVLVFDILLLTNFLFKVVSPERIKSKQFRISSLSVIILFSIIVVIFGVINFNTIRTSEYNIELRSSSLKINHLKIAFVADFHLQEGTSSHFVERFVNRIEMIKPDIMIFGGDIIDGDRHNENLDYIEKLLSTINPKYGVYAVLGNHEYYSQQDKGSFFDKAGMHLLCDTVINIDNSFNISGRYDSHFKERKNIKNLVKSATDSIPLILIDHRPTEIEQVSKTTVDVQLSGHTHNGQLFPINLITRRVYELSWGYKQIRNTHFFVTSGIRLWGPPVRTTGKSEIMVIDITFTKQ